MTEFKFNIGDKVRVLKANGNGWLKPGDIETIRGIVIKSTVLIRENKTTTSNKTYYLLQFDYQNGNKFTAGQLEKVENNKENRE